MGGDGRVHPLDRRRRASASRRLASGWPERSGGIRRTYRSRAKRLGLDAFIVGLLGWRGTDAFSPASRVGFSELFGGSFDGPLQLCFAVLCHGGAPSPRPAL